MRTYKDVEQLAFTLNELDEETGQIPLPYSWALLFLFRWSKFIRPLLPNHTRKELDEIVDWIENGSPYDEEDE